MPPAADGRVTSPWSVPPSRPGIEFRSPFPCRCPDPCPGRCPCALSLALSFAGVLRGVLGGAGSLGGGVGAGLCGPRAPSSPGRRRRWRRAGIPRRWRRPRPTARRASTWPAPTGSVGGASRSRFLLLVRTPRSPIVRGSRRAEPSPEVTITVASCPPVRLPPPTPPRRPPGRAAWPTTSAAAPTTSSPRSSCVRPDLARPAPSDLTSLAARAGTRASVQRAIESLDLGHLQVLEAVVVAGDGSGSGTVDELMGGLDVRSQLQRLWDLALAWRAPEGLYAVRTAPEVLGAHPAGLGPSSLELGARPLSAARDPATWSPTPPSRPAACSTGSSGVRRSGVVNRDAPGSEGVRWLLDHRLLHVVTPTVTERARGETETRVLLPREVALLLRGGRLHQAVALSSAGRRDHLDRDRPRRRRRRR